MLTRLIVSAFLQGLLFASCVDYTFGQDYLERSYTFETYKNDFSKTYANVEEHNARSEIFQANLAKIMRHNRQEHTSFTMGINEFMDLRPDEVPKGYTKPHLQHDSTATSRKLWESPLPPVDPVTDLPNAVDWRTKGVTTPVKNQGGCGSCWAFASVSVLESHVAIRTGTLYTLSVQEFVSCADNPHHCGGAGGCTGATSEIVFEYTRQHGVVEEWDFGYQSFHGEDVNCTIGMDTTTSGLLRGNKSYTRNAVAGIDGWVALPRNNYTVVMNVLAKLGPIAVSVAASPWVFYKGGVFSTPMVERTQTDVNHLVVLEGYGTDEETGEDYWLVRNSWGPRWGEGGYIRLKRVDPSTLDDPEKDCGLDVTPTDGVACTKDDGGNDIVPPAAKVCGTSGILFDAAIPLGGHLL